MNSLWDIVLMLSPALVAGGMIALIHVPLGIEVLKRGIIFLDLAVAQFAALGMVSFHLFLAHSPLPDLFSQFGALLFGLLFAVVYSLSIHALEKYSGRYQEAIIGSSFVVAASVSVLLLASDPHGGETIQDILSGQILWVTWLDLAMYAPVFLLLTAVWLFFKASQGKFFYILFALTIPFSVNLMGVYLVFASLIFPAFATVKFQRYRARTAYLISVLAFMFGLMASYLGDIPSGPAIVISLLIVSFSTFLIHQLWHPKA